MVEKLLPLYLVGALFAGIFATYDMTVKSRHSGLLVAPSRAFWWVVICMAMSWLAVIAYGFEKD